MDNVLARLEAVILVDPAAQGVGKLLLLFLEFKVHAVSPHRPRIIWVMMFFCISLEPP